MECLSLGFLVGFTPSLCRQWAATGAFELIKGLFAQSFQHAVMQRAESIMHWAGGADPAPVWTEGAHDVFFRILKDP